VVLTTPKTAARARTFRYRYLPEDEVDEIRRIGARKTFNQVGHRSLGFIPQGAVIRVESPTPHADI
jgi:hypothetical protein